MWLACSNAQTTRYCAGITSTPIEEMVKEAKKADGIEKAMICDKLAKYFYPPLKAQEITAQVEGEIIIDIGGNDIITR